MVQDRKNPITNTMETKDDKSNYAQLIAKQDKKLQNSLIAAQMNSLVLFDSLGQRNIVCNHHGKHTKMNNISPFNMSFNASKFKLKFFKK